MHAKESESLAAVYLPLRVVYGLTPIVAGLDKFFNLLANWGDYLPATIVEGLPISVSTLMGGVGCIEVMAGLAVLLFAPRLGAWVVTAWLTAIALTLILAGHYDIAVRDLVMAVGAYALAQLAALRGESWLGEAAEGGVPGETTAQAQG